MDRLDAQQRRLGRVEAARVEILLCAREPAAGQTFALGVVVALQFEIVRLLGKTGAQARDAGLRLARVDEGAAFLEAGAGAAGDQNGRAGGEREGETMGKQFSLLCAGCASGSAEGR